MYCTISPKNRQASVGVDRLEEHFRQTAPPRHQHLFVALADLQLPSTVCYICVMGKTAERIVLGCNGGEVNYLPKHNALTYLARSRLRLLLLGQLAQAVDRNPRHPGPVLLPGCLALHVPIAGLREVPREVQERRRLLAPLRDRKKQDLHKVPVRQVLRRSRVNSIEF